MRKTRKPLLIAMCALVAALGVNATYAWLTDTTEAVTNTFTVGNIDIELDESDDLDLKMIPGCEIEKDPVVTVLGGSEDCWLFVKVDESEVLDKYIDYTIAGGWIAGDDENGVPAGVYYREVPARSDDADFNVIGYMKDGSFVENKVLVKAGVTKDDMDELSDEGAIQPTLAFTAYAVQKAGFDTAADAWGAYVTQNA